MENLSKKLFMIIDILINIFYEKIKIVWWCYKLILCMVYMFLIYIGRHSNTGPQIQLPWEKESTETDSKKKILKFPSLIICNNNMTIAFFVSSFKGSWKLWVHFFLSRLYYYYIVVILHISNSSSSLMKIAE